MRWRRHSPQLKRATSCCWLRPAPALTCSRVSNIGAGYSKKKFRVWSFEFRVRANPRLVTRKSKPRGAMPQKLQIDKWLFSATIGLVLFGVVMVYSASAVIAIQENHSQFHYVIKQGVWTLIGFAALFLAMRF